jgi:hypothetical protein
MPVQGLTISTFNKIDVDVHYLFNYSSKLYSQGDIRNISEIILSWRQFFIRTHLYVWYFIEGYIEV